ncbi:MAG: diguanylate cyclase [Veillonellaceae bacterium]|nr:diguanylate cyclase [Veillonellaceae bacterium]
MKLGTRIAISHSLFGLIAIFAIYLLVDQVWVKTFDQLEQKAVRENVNRARLIWGKEQKTLQSIVGDWAPWDDLYEFARNPQNRKFVVDNLPDSAMVNLRIDGVAVTDPTGRILFAKTIDTAQKQETPVSAEFYRHIRPEQLFFADLQGDRSAAGVVWMENMPVLIAAQRILKSDKTGDSPGILIFLRKVDADLLAEITEIVQAPVRVETGETYRMLVNEHDNQELETASAAIIQSLLPMHDIYGNIPFVLVVETSRALSLEVQRHLKYFVAILVGLIALIVSLSIVDLKRMVIRRLENMDSFLRQTDIVDGTSRKLLIDGDDELTQVTVSMNQMLERIAKSQRENEQLNASLQAELVERQLTQQTLLYSSQHDALTGLFNRAYLDESLQRIIRKGADGVGVICCDLDGLKLINDTLGHAAGDRLLQRTADILKEAATQAALVVRTGGDEFVVILTGTTETNLEHISHKILDSCTVSGLTDLPLRLSVGWRYRAHCEVDSNDLDSMLREADDEMYRQKLSSSQSARSGVVQTIMKMLEIRDFETEEHSQRLARLALELAQRAGMSGHRKNDLRLLAQFHDIGKIGIPDKILLKPAALTLEERKEMERHSEIGHRIATVIPELQPVAEFILKHHERWDGKGYPMGLKEEQIPLENRILSIVDAYDAMTSDRPYRQALTEEVAAAELRACRGSQFDPRLTEVFLAMLTDEHYTAGS